MEFNFLVFPSPKCSYNINDPLLHYIHKHDQKKNPNHKIELYSIEQSIISTRTQSNHKIIPCLIINKQYMNKNGCVLYFHANAEDIGMTKDLGYNISYALKVAFIVIEYPGYGIYEGDANSEQILIDAEDSVQCILEIIDQNKLIIMGRSIGTGVAVQLAARYEQLRALILISPFTSLRDVVKDIAGDFISLMIKDRFKSIDTIQNVKCPKIFLHGLQDQLITIKHSVKLQENSIGQSAVLLMDGMDHNYFIYKKHIIEPISKFFLENKI